MKMKRPKKKDTIVFRAGEAMYRRISGIAEDVEITMSDILRRVITKGIAEVERELVSQKEQEAKDLLRRLRARKPDSKAG